MSSRGSSTRLNEASSIASLCAHGIDPRASPAPRFFPPAPRKNEIGVVLCGVPSEDTKNRLNDAEDDLYHGLVELCR